MRSLKIWHKLFLFLTFVGLTLGLCGWGGAQVIKPGLTSYLGVGQLAANGTSLTSLSFAATTSAGNFFFSGNADMATAITIAIPSMIGARIGIRIAQKLSSEVLSLIFNGMSVIMIPMHFMVQEHRKKQNSSSSSSQSSSPSSPPSEEKSPENNFPPSSQRITLSSITLDKTTFMHIGYGTMMGILSSLMGVGGLPLTMSYLTFFTDMPHHLVQGTTMVSNLPSIYISAISLATKGYTPLALAGAVSCGSICGSAFGAHCALSLTEKELRQVFIGSLILFGGSSIFRSCINLRNIFFKAK